MIANFIALSLFLSFLTKVSAINCAAVSCPNTNCSPGSGFCTYRYGTSFDSSQSYFNQEADLYLPSDFHGATAPLPIVVLVHGGYWHNQYTRASGLSDMGPLAENLRERGYVVINLEYRRAACYNDGSTGGFPETFNDLVDGVDALSCINNVSNPCSLAASNNLDLSKVVVVGHSAGGHLALWRALQTGLSSAVRNTYGIHSASVEVLAAVGLAAVSDFNGPCQNDNTASKGAITNLMEKGTKGFPNDSYCNGKNIIHDVVSPLAMLDNANNLFNPLLQLKMVHGLQDSNVNQVQSDRIVTASSSLANIDGLSGEERGDHFDVIDPGNALWTTQVIGFLDSALPLPTSAPSTGPTESPTNQPTRVSSLR